MNGHPRPGGQSPCDQALADSKRQQLPPSHMPVLTPRKVQDRGVLVDFEAISFTIDHYY
jgi:hypothetical protein